MRDLGVCLDPVDLSEGGGEPPCGPLEVCVCVCVEILGVSRGVWNQMCV